VPALSCTSATRAVTPGVGLDGGRTFSEVFVFVGCSHGKAVYWPGLTVDAAETNYTTTPFSAGDVVNMSASVTASGTTVQVADVTKGVTKTLTGAGESDESHAWIGDGPWYAPPNSTLLGVPNFGKLKFFNCLVDGKALQSWQPLEFQRVNAKGIVQIATGPFSPPGGLAFATYYKHQ
jgi:hypothetical protein